jgi:Kyakuja-Dileera-Zisupton transposase
MNMDYSFCQAIATEAKDTLDALLMYDVVCQYAVHFAERVERNPYLSMPENLQLSTGIGVWHVHGHIEECFPRYYPAFIPGTGHVDGEILETLWSHLNLISGSARSMSTSHRQEVLDDHMNDSNWGKWVGIGGLSTCCLQQAV